MTLAGISIKRPVATTMVMISMLVIGFVALLTLRTEMMPNINVPIIVVSSSWNGAVPEDIESNITKKIEDVLPRVEGIKRIRSISAFNSSTVIAEFNYGVDLDVKRGDMQKEVDTLKGTLPNTASEPQVRKMTVDGGGMTMQLVASGPSAAELTSFVDEFLKPRLERIEGVGSIDIAGAAKKQIQIQFDSEKLKAYNLTPTELYSLIRASNINSPLGTVKSGGKEIVARLLGELKDLDELKNMVIKSGGKSLKLSDVADVVLTTEDQDSYAIKDNDKALALSINKSSKGNTVSINRDALLILDEIKEYTPENINLDVTFDSAEAINASISSVTSNALSGLILATIILFLFLKNIRATLLVTLALPISIMFTFMFLYFADVNLNLVSLMGLSIGVGMLTDNSVVVIDNIYRHITEYKKGIRVAAEDGASEVTGSIIGSALTTMVVFIPILFIPGLAREIFRDMAFAIIFSNLAAIIVSLTLMPMVASRFLSEKVDITQEGKLFSKVKRTYTKLLDSAFLSRKKTLFIAVFAFVFMMVIGQLFVKTDFFPKQDLGKFSMSAELPKGKNVNEGALVAERMQEIAKNNKYTKNYSTLVSNKSVIVNVDVGLRSERDVTLSQIQDMMRKELQEIPDIKSSISENFRSGAGGQAVEFRVKGNDISAIENVARLMQEKLKNEDGLLDVSISVQSGNQEARLVMDREKMKALGVNGGDIARTVSYAFQGGSKVRGETVTFKTGTEEIEALVRLAPEKRENLDSIKNLNIRSADGTFVRVGDVTDIVFAEGTSEITKVDKIYTISVKANDGGIGLAKMQDKFLAAYQSIDVPNGISYDFGGESEMMGEAMDQMKIALIISIFLIYAILAAQFENFTLPFIIIGSIPLAMIGVYSGLLVTARPFDLMVMIGIIMLAGTVVNNAIILIDYIEILRRRGLDRDKAIKEACLTRLRPILMTTMTTVLGMVPLALGIGQGSELYGGMSIAVIFGLSFSTLLTLVVIPVLYTLIEDSNDRVKRKAKKALSKI